MGVHAASRLLGRVTQLVSEELARPSSKPPDTLDHCTTPKGLLGIIESSALFLSDARFVNDRSELSYGRRVFTDRLLRYAEASGSDVSKAVWDHFTKAVEDRLQRQQRPTVGWTTVPYDHFYVASFCTDGNLLSQWRAYGTAANGGCSIGFRALELIAGASIDGNNDPASTGPAATLQQVLYEPDLQNAFVDNVLTTVFSVLNDDRYQHSNAALYLANTIDIVVIPATTSCIKAPVFREEQEWRLVCRRSAGVQYRVQKGRIVPYLKCKLRSSGAEPWRGNLPISKVFIGPSEASELLQLSIRDLLRSHGFVNETVSVVPCDIPLRTP